MELVPFRIAIPDAELDDLRARLKRTRWTDQPVDIHWELGSDRAFLERLADHWSGAFEWRAREAALNALPQFTTKLGDHTLHFVHARGKGDSMLPLLLTHGWPGSFAEFAKLIPMLTHPTAHGASAHDAFDVIVPSLPGYGFSSRPPRTGIDAFAIADLWAELMTRLGYERFAAQGGDLGASVSTALGLHHAERMIAIHLNFIPGSFQTAHEPDELTEEERAWPGRRAAWGDAEGGYSHLHGTRPQSLAHALNDSPVGLAAWVVEKFRAWSDCGGDIENCFSFDELLTNISIYWFTQTIGASMRLYAEIRKRPMRFERGQFVRVPCAVAHFPREIPIPPRSLVERAYHVLRWTEMRRGGHFAALEQPALLADDIRTFLRPFRSAVVN